MGTVLRCYLQSSNVSNLPMSVLRARFRTVTNSPMLSSTAKSFSSNLRRLRTSCRKHLTNNSASKWSSKKMIGFIKNGSHCVNYLWIEGVARIVINWWMGLVYRVFCKTMVWMTLLKVMPLCFRTKCILIGQNNTQTTRVTSPFWIRNLITKNIVILKIRSK